MDVKVTGVGDGSHVRPWDRTTPAAESHAQGQLHAEAWPPPPPRDLSGGTKSFERQEKSSDESAKRMARIVSDEKTLHRATDLLYNAARGDNRDGRMSEFAQLRSDVYKQVRQSAKSDAEAREMMWQFDDNVARSIKASSQGHLKVDSPLLTADGAVTVSIWDSNRLDWLPLARVNSTPARDCQAGKGKPVGASASSEHNYDAQSKQIREEIRNDSHSTRQMSENIRKIFDGIPREDRARALMQAYHHFGFLKYIQTSDEEATITASSTGGKIGLQTPEVKLEVPEDKAVIPTKDVPDAVRKIADYLTKEPDAVRAHAVLNGYPPGERARILQQAVRQANSRVGDTTALIVEELPGGKERLSVAALHPASGRNFDPSSDLSLSIIVPSEKVETHKKANGDYKQEVDALKTAMTKWDGVAAHHILQGIPPEDRMNAMAQASHRWDCSRYREEADGTAKVGAGRGIFFPMEEGPWIEKDRVNVLHAVVEGDKTQIKPKDATEGAQWIAYYLNAHDGIYAHRVLNSFPENERKAVLQQSVDYWNQHYNKAKNIPGTQLQVKTERLPGGKERLSIDDTLSILVPVARR